MRVFVLTLFWSFKWLKEEFDYFWHYFALASLLSPGVCHLVLVFFDCRPLLKLHYTV